MNVNDIASKLCKCGQFSKVEFYMEEKEKLYKLNFDEIMTDDETPTETVCLFLKRL